MSQKPPTTADLIRPRLGEPAPPPKNKKSRARTRALTNYSVPPKPKDMKHLVELARDHSWDAIQMVHNVMMDPETSRSLKLKAAEILFDRGYGKPAQQMRVDSEMLLGHDLSEISNEELEKMIAKAAIREPTIVEATVKPEPKEPEK